MEISLAMSILLKSKKLKNMTTNKMLELKDHITNEIKKLKEEGKTDDEIKQLLHKDIESILSSQNIPVTNEVKNDVANTTQEQQQTTEPQQPTEPQQTTNVNNENVNTAQPTNPPVLDPTQTQTLLNDVNIKELMIKGYPKDQINEILKKHFED